MSEDIELGVLSESFAEFLHKEWPREKAIAFPAPAIFSTPHAGQRWPALGWPALAARAMGADFAYIGSPIIATEEAVAAPEYKQMLIDCTAEDIVYSNLFTGVHDN